MFACACAAAAETAIPAAVRSVLPAAQAGGAGTLTWLGFRAYDARLWVAPGFRAAQFERHAFALELNYHRAFRARDIARRSLQEMARGPAIDAGDAQRWQAALERVLPDVQPGDRITGVHRPGQGVLFLVNGRAAGEVEDPRFAQPFFGIWLAPHTSAPALRNALLAPTPP